jgi:hypothetical protein
VVKKLKKYIYIFVYTSIATSKLGVAILHQFETFVHGLFCAAILNEARGARDICRAIGSSFLPFNQVF